MTDDSWIAENQWVIASAIATGVTQTVVLIGVWG